MKAHPQQTRDRAIEGLLLGKDVKAAAKYAGMARRTLHRWITEDHDFRLQLDRARQQMFDLHIAQLAELTGTAIRRLREILEDNDASRSDWLRAAEMVMREARNSEAAEIREMIRQLQEAVNRRS
jgi:hypothetical protein